MIMDVNGYPRERPVQMGVTGRIQPLVGSTKEIQIDSMYNIALFDAMPDIKNIRWAFEIPEGVYCEGFPSEKKPPNKLATAFSMRVEVLYWPHEKSGQEYLSTIRNWYDFNHKLTRADSIPTIGTSEFAVAGPVQVAVIKDFFSGVEYIINKGLGNCTTLVLDGDGYDTITTPDGHYAIKDPMTLFGLKDTNLTYQGMKYARGLPCDVWIGRLENSTLHETYTYELYFLQSGWQEEAGEHEKSLPVPVMISVHIVISDDQTAEDITIDIKQNIFKYEEQEPLLSVYDITPCFFGHEHIRRFQMAFPGKFRQYFEENPARFTLWVRDSLVIFLEIPAIRLQHVQIEYLVSDGRLYCEFTLVDQPQVDMTMPPYVGKPLEKVVEHLKNSMDKIAVIIIDQEGYPRLMKPIEDSLMEMFEDGCYSTQAPAEPPQDLNDLELPQPDTPSHHHQERGSTEREERSDEAKSSTFASLNEMQQFLRSSDGKIYTPGDMAGMAIGMLVLGLILGIVIMLVILKKMGLSSDFELIPMNSGRR